MLLGSSALIAAAALNANAEAQAQTAATPIGNKPPNILVIWGDDIGTWNISHNNRGMMGYKTPNIDRIAREGVSFTDYYGQQSCTAGRAAFIGGVFRSAIGHDQGGLPGAKEGWQKPTIHHRHAPEGLGLRHRPIREEPPGDRDEHLPTMHGFDEFFGSLYHLNASEEPENRDYPKRSHVPQEIRSARRDPSARPTARVAKRIENTGPLTKKRMETIDEETLAAAKDFITRQKSAGTPFFCWWNATRMHFRTHVKAEHRGISGQDEYSDGMVEHDMRRSANLLKLIDDLGIANDTIVVLLDRQRPALQHLARCRHHRRSVAKRTPTGKVPTAFRLHPLARPVSGAE